MLMGPPASLPGSKAWIHLADLDWLYHCDWVDGSRLHARNMHSCQARSQPRRSEGIRAFLTRARWGLILCDKPRYALRSFHTAPRSN